MSISLYTILKENEKDIERIMEILREDEGMREIDYYGVGLHRLLGREEWYTGLTFSIEKAIKEEEWKEVSRIIMRGSRSRKREGNEERINDLGIQFVWSYPEQFDENFEREVMDTEYMCQIYLVSPHILEKESGMKDERIIKTFSHRKYDLWANPFTIHLNVKRIVESGRKNVIKWMIESLYKIGKTYLEFVTEYFIEYMKYELIELFLEMKESEKYEGNLMKEIIKKNDGNVEDLMIKIWNHPNKRMRDDTLMYVYSFHGWVRLMEMILNERDIDELIMKGGEWKSYFEEFYEEEDRRRMMKKYKERIEGRYIFLGWRDDLWYRVIDYF